MVDRKKETIRPRPKSPADLRIDPRNAQVAFTTLFNSVSDTALIYGGDGIILAVNPAGEALLEWDVDKLTGRHIKEVLGNSEDHILCSGRDKLTKGDFEVESYLVSSSGGRIDVEARLKLVEFGGGSCVLLIARVKREREIIAWQSDPLRHTIDSLAYPFAVIDVNDYSIVVANSGGKAMGLDQGAKCYGALYNRDKPCDTKKTKCLVETIRQTGRPFACEYTQRAVKPDGNRYKIYGYPVFDPDGNVAQIISYILNVTSQRRAEESLLESEECFRNLMDYLPGVSIQGYSTDGTVRYWNKASQEVYGYTAGEAIGRNLAELIIPASILPLFKKGLKIGKKATESGELMPSGELALKHKDGSDVPVYSIHTVVCLEGKENLMFCIDVDLSERKRIEEQLRVSEERLRTLFENAPVGLYRSTPEGEVLMSNPAMIKMLGYESFEDLKKINIISDGYEEGSSRREFLDLIEKQGEVDGFRSTWLKKNGDVLEIEEISRAIRGPDGRTKYYEGIVRDITLKSQLEKELIKASKLESIGLLAGGIAHDFNNLLAALVINLWSAKRCRDDPEEVKRLIEDSERITKRAKDLTGQLLTFSKGGAPVKKQTSITAIVTDTISLSLGGSNTRCELRVSEDLWTVEADEGQLGQVFSNLLINAGQAMPEGGIVMVEIKNQRVGQGRAVSVSPGDYVRVSVQDAGHGIPEKSLSRIFDPYFTTKQTGSGLGLTTAYSIVKKHGGDISVENNDVKGATFHVLLPASKKKNNRAGRKAEAAIEPQSGMLKILVMDDEQFYRNSLKRILAEMGHLVSAVAEGRQAIELYDEAVDSGREFDIVIMDLTIPGGMGGVQTIAALRQRYPQVRAIVSSGYYDDPVMADYASYGFSGVLAKPFSIENLVREINRIAREE